MELVPSKLCGRDEPILHAELHATRGAERHVTDMVTDLSHGELSRAEGDGGGCMIGPWPNILSMMTDPE